MRLASFPSLFTRYDCDMLRLAALALAFFATAVRAETAFMKVTLSAVYNPPNANNPARLKFALPECPDDRECEILRITCDGDHMRLETDASFSDEQVGRWLVSNGGVLELRNSENHLPMSPIRIVPGHFTGVWTLEWITRDSAAVTRWFDTIDYDKDLIVSTIGEDLVFPSEPQDLRATKSFFDVCLRAISR